MANYRQIHTKIWRDNWFLELDADEKLLFIYLFSNDNTNLAGIYELNDRIIQLETGLDKTRIHEIMAKFEADNKVHFQDGIVWIVNMSKYHSNAGEKAQKNIASIIADLPDGEITKKYRIAHGITTENTVSIPYTYPMDTLSYSKSKSKSKRESNSKSESNTPDGGTCPSSNDQRILSICDHLKESGVQITSNTEQTAKALVSVFKVPDIHDAIDHMKAHTDRPNVAYLKKVLDGWSNERKIQKVY